MCVESDLRPAGRQRSDAGHTPAGPRGRGGSFNSLINTRCSLGNILYTQTLRRVHLPSRKNTVRSWPASEGSHLQHQQEENREDWDAVPPSHVERKRAKSLQPLLHLCHRLQSRDKQPIESPFFKRALRFLSANCVSPCCLICDRLLGTDSAWSASGFRSPAHLPAVYLDAGASVKWQTVPEISLSKSPVCRPSHPVLVLFLQARKLKRKKTKQPQLELDKNCAKSRCLLMNIKNLFPVWHLLAVTAKLP